MQIADVGLMHVGKFSERTFDRYIEITRPRTVHKKEIRRESKLLRCGKTQNQTEFKSQKPVMWYHVIYHMGRNT